MTEFPEVLATLLLLMRWRFSAGAWEWSTTSKRWPLTSATTFCDATFDAATPALKSNAGI